MLARRPQQPLRVLLALHQGSPVDQRLRSVPYYVTNWLLRVYPEQVLQDGQEGDLLRRVLHPHVHCGEHVQVARQVDIVRTSSLCLVTLTLLLKHIELHFEVGVLAGALEVPDDLQQLQADKLIPESVPILQLWGGYNQAVDKSKEYSPILICFSLSQLIHHHTKPVAR